MPHAVITGMIRTVLAAAQEFNLNSQASVSKELVRMLKLSFKQFDVVLFVAPESCALRPPKHQFGRLPVRWWLQWMRCCRASEV